MSPVTPFVFRMCHSHSSDPDQVLSDDDLPPEVRVVELPPEGRVDSISPVTPPASARMSPCSPPVVPLDQSADSSVVISPNHMRLDNSPDLLDAEPVFEVSPDTLGFLMMPSGAAVQASVSCLPLQPGSDSDCPGARGTGGLFPQWPDSWLGCSAHDISCLCSPFWTCIIAGAIFCSDGFGIAAVSSRSDGWSSGVPRTYDVSWEGPFDAYCSPMDTGDSPLVATGLPGCPYRITSYPGPAVTDTNPAYGMQLHHPQFLEFIGAPESARLLYRCLTFWIQRMGAEDAAAAAIDLQRDAGVMLSNLKILSQFVTSLQRISTEMLDLAMGHVVFPSQEVAVCLRRRGRLGRHSIWPQWDYGVLRWVRAIPGLCRLRPAMRA